MSSAKSNSLLTSESVHNVWLNQGEDLQRDLFDGWTPTVRPTESVALPRHEEVPPEIEDVPSRIEAIRPQVSDFLPKPQAQELAVSSAKAVEPLGQAQGRLQTAACALSDDIEVRKDIGGHVPVELSPQCVRERDELLQWRRQAESELARARRQLESEVQRQQQELVLQCEAEMSRLRRDREEFDARVRQSQAELAIARQRQEDAWRETRDVQLAQIRAERAELEKLRSTWMEKLRREQAVLQHGEQFFAQQLSRVGEEFRQAQRSLEEVVISVPAVSSNDAVAEFTSPADFSRPIEPMMLSLDEIRQRLNELKQPRRAAA